MKFLVLSAILFTVSQVPSFADDTSAGSALGPVAQDMMGPYKSVRVVNFSGSLEIFLPNGVHRLLKTGDVPPQITDDLSGIILRVLRGTLTIEVERVEKGKVKLEELVYITSDLVRITLSGENQDSESKWEVFHSIDKTAIDRGIADTTESQPGEGLVQETSRELGIGEVPQTPEQNDEVPSIPISPERP